MTDSNNTSSIDDGMWSLITVTSVIDTIINGLIAMVLFHFKSILLYRLEVKITYLG